MKTYNEKIEELKKKKFGRKFDDFRRMVRNINKEKASKRCKPFHIVKDLGLVSVHKQKAFFELYEDFCRNNAKIEQLNELRREAIEEIKEMQEEIDKPTDGIKTINKELILIDYLKAEWNIEEKDLNV